MLGEGQVPQDSTPLSSRGSIRMILGVGSEGEFKKREQKETDRDRQRQRDRLGQSEIETRQAEIETG